MGGQTGHQCTQLNLTQTNQRLINHNPPAERPVMRPNAHSDLMTLINLTSYVHSNRHPEQNHLIPAIAVSGLDGEVMAIMYDSYHDVMLHIHPLNWIDVTNNLYVDCGVFILWLLLHHRLFLRGISQFDLPKAQLVNIFTQLNVLGHYKSLTNYNVVDWPKRLTPLGYMRTKRISLGEESISTPQVKKTKSNTDELGK